MREKPVHKRRLAMIDVSCTARTGLKTSDQLDHLHMKQEYCSCNLLL